MFKLSPASRQTFIDTPNYVLEDRVQYSMVRVQYSMAHTLNVLVFCEVHLQTINCVRTVRIHWAFRRTGAQRLLDHPVLVTFAKLEKETISLFMSVRPSALNNTTTVCTRNFLFEYFSKICGNKNSSFGKI
jgi:hypothetical protein